MDELKTIAEQSVARAQEVAGTSQRTVEVSRTGQRVVEETVGSMREIRARVEGIAENILALSEQTQQIGEIIATVNEIAAQSNILALNASVEAARAGEYGKGFAVVAVEVRNLAEQSRQATAQVRAILSDIQKATNATVMATEEGTKQVEEGMVLALQSGESIEQLAGVIEESAQAATQMVAGGRQQATGVEQVAVAMQSINQATVQSLASTREAEKAAKPLHRRAMSRRAGGMLLALGLAAHASHWPRIPAADTAPAASQSHCQLRVELGHPPHRSRRLLDGLELVHDVLERTLDQQHVLEEQERGAQADGAGIQSPRATDQDSASRVARSGYAFNSAQIFCCA